MYACMLLCCLFVADWCCGLGCWLVRWALGLGAFTMFFTSFNPPPLPLPNNAHDTFGIYSATFSSPLPFHLLPSCFLPVSIDPSQLPRNSKREKKLFFFSFPKVVERRSCPLSTRYISKADANAANIVTTVVCRRVRFIFWLKDITIVVCICTPRCFDISIASL
jgi:hypothetical protein